jgi:hypothetical protein
VLRHTNLYASVQDLSVIRRTHDDWQGIFCSNLTVDSIETVLSKNSVEESDAAATAADAATPGTHGHATRHQAHRGQASADDTAYKAEKIGILRSHFFEVLNIVESATVRADLDKFFALAEDAIFALRRQLPNLPLRSRTTVAKRPAGEAAARKKSARRKTNAKTQKEAAAPRAMQQRASRLRASPSTGGSAQRPIRVDSSSASSGKSDCSSSQSSIVGFAHGSDVDSDSQTSYSDESEEDY